jgi:hypothetical protein
MTYKEWAESFTIFDKYTDPDKPFGDVSAEHDEIYAGPDPEDVSIEDKERLDTLGWQEEDKYGCFSYFI